MGKLEIISKSFAVSVLWTFITLAITGKQVSGAIFSNAQYSSTLLPCDSSRLHRCQQDILQDMQTVSLNSASLQYPISGPPYSPKAQQQLVSPSTCRLIRANLECLLVTTPTCYDQGSQAAQNTDIILRAKRFLEQNSCNEPDTTWQGTICYRSPEIRSCEERYGFSNSFATGALTSNVSACLAYQAFKYCIETHLRYNCRVHESDMMNEYLIDRASDLAWRCPANSTNTPAPLSHYSGNYQLNNQPGSVLSPSLSNYNNFAHYDQRPILPTYVGSQGSGLSLFSANRDQAWERFRNPLDETRYGISRYPSGLGAGNGEVFDRLVAPGSGFETESSDCPNKAEPYTRECEDTLRDQQRLAKDARDGNELQRRICCSLFQYRDCVSRVVLDRCADSTPTAVDILMGVRRREMTFTCRGFNRDVCSGSLTLQVPNLTILLTLAIIISILTFKQNTFPHF